MDGRLFVDIAQDSIERVPSPVWLLLPGHMCDASMWSGAREALDRSGRHVVVADLTRDGDIDALARRALSQAEGPLVLIGFSMGGIVALRMCALTPERIVGLVMVDSNARPDLPERSAMRHAHQQRARAGGLSEIVRNEMAPHYFAANHRDHRRLTETAIETAEAVGADVFVYQSEAIRTRPDARPSLGRIACPTLVIAGEQDALCPPEWQRELASGIPGAELILVSSAGHFVPLEAPDRFIEAVFDWGDRHCLT